MHTAETVQAAQGSKQAGMPLNAVNATYLTRIVLKRIAEQEPLERVAYTMDDIEPEGNASGMPLLYTFPARLIGEPSPGALATGCHG